MSNDEANGRVAEQDERYWVVEKVGVAAALVRRDDAQHGQMVL